MGLRKFHFWHTYVGDEGTFTGGDFDDDPIIGYTDTGVTERGREIKRLDVAYPHVEVGARVIVQGRVTNNANGRYLEIKNVFVQEEMPT